MPIYEFHCKECRGEFKTLRALEKLNEVACPTCGSERVARLLSITAQKPAADETCARPGGCCRMGYGESCQN